MREVKTVKSAVYKNESATNSSFLKSWNFFQPLDEFQKFSFKVLISNQIPSGFWNHHQLTVLQFRPVLTIDLSHPSFGAVPQNGLAELLRNRKSDGTSVGFQKKNLNPPSPPDHPFFNDFPKRIVFFQDAFTGKFSIKIHRLR
jgi:hypothetical protein